MSVKGEKIEEVKVMKYLGAMFNEEGSCEDEVESRIGGAEPLGHRGRKLLTVRS